MVHGDDNGLVLPPYVAPIQVMIVPIQQSKPGVMKAALKLKEELDKSGYRVQIDDSDKSPGWKFADSEMKGIPVRIEIGPRDLEKNQCLMVLRHNGERTNVDLAEVVQKMPDLLADIHKAMFEKAKKQMLDNTHAVKDYETFKRLMAKNAGYVKMMWCGDDACETRIKEETTATARCIPFEQEHLGDICPVCGKKRNLWFSSQSLLSQNVFYYSTNSMEQCFFRYNDFCHNKST